MLLPMIENMQNSVYSQQNNGIGANFLPQDHNSAATFAVPDVVSALNRVILPATIEDKPLISSDNKTVQALGNKILSLKSILKNEDGTSEDTPALSEIEREVVVLIMKVLLSTTPDTDVGDINKFADDACGALSRIIADHQSAQMSCLFLTRLLILREDLIYGSSATTSLVDMIMTRLAIPLGSSGAFSSVPSVVMALCTMANLISHSKGQSLILDRPNVAGSLVDIAVNSFSHPRVEIRQMSATVAFNFAMTFTKSTELTQGQVASLRLIVSADGELNPLAVQLLCGAMEGVTVEKDSAVRYRRFCITLKIARLGGDTVGSLGRDLGFGNDLTAFKSSETEHQVVEELKRFF